MVSAGAGIYMSLFASQYTGAGVGMFIGAAVLLLVKVYNSISYHISQQGIQVFVVYTNEVFLTSVHIATHADKNIAASSYIYSEMKRIASLY